MTTITPEFDQVLSGVEQRMGLRRGQGGLLVDGSAGTGKSTLIRILRERYPQAVIAAPTGVAATLVGGTTVHRLFNFPLKLIEPALDRENSYPSQVLRKLKLLILEEVGMIRSDLIDGMDYYLRRATRRSSPFGGVTVVMLGDAFQLPPVVRSDERNILLDRLGYRSEHFFDAKVWSDCTLDRITLTRVFRQQDPDFTETLGRVRTGDVTERDLARLNTRCGQPIPKDAVVLTPTREAAEKFNTEALQALGGKLHAFASKSTGDFKPADAPSDANLMLKHGSLVMLLANNKGEWQNGTTGVFEGVQNGNLLVRTRDGRLLEVGRHTWKRFRYRWDERAKAIEQVELGSFEQYPVRLAHALTIHKAQGQTLPAVVLDTGGRGVFAPGQMYVGLSRVTSLSGLYLRHPVAAQDCRADPRVKEFFDPPEQPGEQIPIQLMRQGPFSLSFVA